MQGCTLCPRACGTDRQIQRGFCGVTGEAPLVSRVALHPWEEPCISGERGSGTVFFCGCNLRCIFCQNQKISRGNGGKPYSVQALAQAYLSLQAQGAHNINLVTATHYVPQVAQSLRLAKEHGLHIPVVYNCGGYESAQTLSLLCGLVDVYLPDFKFWDAKTASELAAAPDYPTVVRRAIKTMVAQTGAWTCNADGMATRGVLIRHLVLPEHTRAAKQILTYLWHTYGNAVAYSIMRQYTPMEGATGALARPVYDAEYEAVIAHAQDLGITNAYTQAPKSVGSEYIPDFE